MKLENLSLYLENLLPGVVILSCILLLIPSSEYSVNIVIDLSKSEFLLSVLFLAASYLLGLISAVISRAVIDVLSAQFPRPMFLIIHTKKRYKELKDILNTYVVIETNKDSETKAQDIKQSVWNKKYRTEWNNIYKLAFSTVLQYGPEKGANEVLRRREQGRLVRNLFFPLLISTLVITYNFFQIRDWWILTTACVLIFLFSLLLYAYSEYFSFAEAILHLKPKNAGFSLASI